MKPETERLIRDAVIRLSATARGRRAMADALAMLDNGAISLDQYNRTALMNLITAAFTCAPGSARDAMRDAVEEVPS